MAKSSELSRAKQTLNGGKWAAIGHKEHGIINGDHMLKQRFKMKWLVYAIVGRRLRTRASKVVVGRRATIRHE